MTDEEMINLFKNECFYCDGYSNKFKINGIDRLDNNIPYTLENCVPACGMCNRMKRVDDLIPFIKKVCHIHKFNESNWKRLMFPEVFENHQNVRYCDYNYRADKYEKWDLTEELFNQIFIKNCYLCGKEPTNLHKNGIDRVNNNIGYEVNNMKSCCMDCNYLKFEYTLDDFLDKCHKIYEYSYHLIC